MKTWVHFTVCSVLAVLLYPIFGWKVIFVFAGGVLIDIDHYFWYVYKFRKFSPFSCYTHFIKGLEGDNYKHNIGILLALHTIEFLVICLALSFFTEYALIFTIGLLSHYILDLVYLISGPKFFIASTSTIAWLVKNMQKV